MNTSTSKNKALHVLFVIKGKIDGQVSPFIQEQIYSLREQGVNVEMYEILGKGIKQYFSNIPQLRSLIKRKKFNIIHAHYGLCAWTSWLTFSKIPIVVSIMGSDILGEYKDEKRITFKSRFVVLSTKLLQFLINQIIAKSINIYDSITNKKITSIIPNGVNINKVFYLNDKNYREKLGLNKEKLIILFLGNKENKWKNFLLSEEAVNYLQNDKVELIAPYPLSHHEVVEYLSAADIFLHTSFMEGSSNVIKEAMACNCPIVATNVGDAKMVIGETEGCYITTFSVSDVVNKLKLAIEYATSKGRTKGLNRIKQLELDSESIALKIINVYHKALNTSKL